MSFQPSHVAVCQKRLTSVCCPVATCSSAMHRLAGGALGGLFGGLAPSIGTRSTGGRQAGATGAGGDPYAGLSEEDKAAVMVGQGSSSFAAPSSLAALTTGWLLSWRM